MTGITVRLQRLALFTRLWRVLTAMALLTNHPGMPASQAIIRILVVVELLRRPASDCVAILALLSVTPPVQVIVAVAADAGLGNSAIVLLRMAIPTGHPLVLAA